MAKAYKQHKKGQPRFVQMFDWVQQTEAWATMPPGPRTLYIELKRRYSGSNNGQLFLSHRDAAKACHAHRNTVGNWFRVLQERGFITMTRGAFLGPSGTGVAATWALTELPTSEGKKATMDFKKWKSPAQKPCMTGTKIVHTGAPYQPDAQNM